MPWTPPPPCWGRGPEPFPHPRAHSRSSRGRVVLLASPAVPPRAQHGRRLLRGGDRRRVGADDTGPSSSSSSYGEQTKGGLLTGRQIMARPASATSTPTRLPALGPRRAAPGPLERLVRPLLRRRLLTTTTTWRQRPHRARSRRRAGPRAGASARARAQARAFSRRKKSGAAGGGASGIGHALAMGGAAGWRNSLGGRGSTE